MFVIFGEIKQRSFCLTFVWGSEIGKPIRCSKRLFRWLQCVFFSLGVLGGFVFCISVVDFLLPWINGDISWYVIDHVLLPVRLFVWFPSSNDLETFAKRERPGNLQAVLQTQRGSKLFGRVQSGQSALKWPWSLLDPWHLRDYKSTKG